MMEFTYEELESLALDLVYLDVGISPLEAFCFFGLLEDHSAPYRYTLELLPYSDFGNIDAATLLSQLSTGDIAYFTNADLCRVKILMDNSLYYRELIELELPSSESHLNMEVWLRHFEPHIRPEDRPREREESIIDNVQRSMRKYAINMISRLKEREMREVYNLVREEMTLSKEASQASAVEANRGEVDDMHKSLFLERIHVLELSSQGRPSKNSLVSFSQHDRITGAEEDVREQHSFTYVRRSSRS